MAKITVNEEVCKGCGLCDNACPKKIIGFVKERTNNKGYHPARLMKPEECVGCCACAMMCPDMAITVER